MAASWEGTTGTNCLQYTGRTATIVSDPWDYPTGSDHNSFCSNYFTEVIIELERIEDDGFFHPPYAWLPFPRITGRACNDKQVRHRWGRPIVPRAPPLRFRI